MLKRLVRACESVRPDVVRLVRQLACLPGYSFEESRIADRVHETLEKLGYDLVFRDAVGNVVGILAGSTPGPVLLLNSHMDTARPRDETGGYDVPPGGIRQGHVHGIGTATCKGALAAQLYGGYVLHRTSPFFRGVLVVAATVAEQDGCGLGTAHLLRHTLPELNLEPALMILGEPTALDLRHSGDGRAVVVAGIAGADAKAVARAADGVYRRLARQTASGAGPAPVAVRVLRPEYNGKTRALREARLEIACRIPPGVTVGSCLSWIRAEANQGNSDLVVGAEVLRERRGLFTGMVADVVHSSEPWSTDSGDPVVRCASEALRASDWVHGRVRRRSRPQSHGETSSKNLLRYGVPTLGFGPGEERLANAPRESVSIDEIGESVFGTAVLSGAILDPPARIATPAWGSGG